VPTGELERLRAILDDSFLSINAMEQRAREALDEFRKTEIKLRRARESHFPCGYFSDVAWDILLDLDSAAREGKQFAITDLCVEAKVPLATVLRYLNKLTADGYIQRSPDSKDRRRFFIALTDAGQRAMDSVFDDIVSPKTHAPKPT
jgi:DNA-binding MarR family transcriptional regulator